MPHMHRGWLLHTHLEGVHIEVFEVLKTGGVVSLVQFPFPVSPVSRCLSLKFSAYGWCMTDDWDRLIP